MPTRLIKNAAKGGTTSTPAMTSTTSRSRTTHSVPSDLVKSTTRIASKTAGKTATPTPASLVKQSRRAEPANQGAPNSKTALLVASIASLAAGIGQNNLKDQEWNPRITKMLAELSRMKAELVASTEADLNKEFEDICRFLRAMNALRKAFDAGAKINESWVAKGASVLFAGIEYLIGWWGAFSSAYQIEYASRSDSLLSPESIHAVIIHSLTHHSFLLHHQFASASPTPRRFSQLELATQHCRGHYPTGLKVVASGYYNLGGVAYQSGRYELAVEPFRRSCDLLDEYLEKTNQKDNAEEAGALEKRMELLGASLLKLRQYQDALKVFFTSLARLLPTQLPSFVSSLNRTSLCNTARLCPTLPRTIDRIIRISLVELVQTNFKLPHEYIDAKENGRAEAVGGMLEYELTVLHSFFEKTDIGALMLKVVDEGISIYNEQKFPIRRARISIEKAKLLWTIGEENASLEADALLNCAIDLLKSEEYGADAGLQQLRCFYLGVAYAWHGIAALPICRMDAFKKGLQLWKGILRKIPLLGSGALAGPEDTKATLAAIDDVEKFYGFLNMLADLFSLLDRPIQHLLTLKLMLRLNNGLRTEKDTCHQDGIQAYIRIGEVYTLLGYSGKAGMAFLQAKRLMESTACPNEAKVRWLLRYSYHLCSSGNIKNALPAFNETTTLADFKAGHKNSLSATQKRERHILVTDACLTRSTIAYATGSLHQATQDATRALRMLGRVLNGLARQSKLSKEDQEKTSNNPFVSVPSDGKFAIEDVGEREGMASEDSLKALHKNQWGLTRKLLDTYALLGKLYVARGSAREADYYFRKGRMLADMVGAKVLAARFLLHIAELECRKREWEETKENLETTLKYQQETEVLVKDQASAITLGGDLQLQQCLYTNAVGEYERAEGLLKTMMTSEFIDELERTEPLGNYTPREKKVIPISMPVTPTTAVKGRKLKQPDGTQLEWVVLDNMKSSLFYRTAWALCKQGEIQSGEKLLADLEKARLFGEEEMEYYLIRAKFEVCAVLDEFASDTLLSMLEEAVLAIPLIAQSSQPKTAGKTASRLKLATKPVKNSAKLASAKKSTVDSSALTAPTLDVDAALEHRLDRAIEHVRKAFSIGFDGGAAHLAYEACLYFALATMLRTYSDPKKLRGVEEEAVRNAAMYLELAKGITARRDMLSSLEMKLAPAQSQDLAWVDLLTLNNEEVVAETKTVTDPAVVSIEDEEDWDVACWKRLHRLYLNEQAISSQHFQQHWVNALPITWTVCSIALDPESQNLYFTRLRAQQLPFIVRMPLNRHEERDSSDGEPFGYTEATEALGTLLEQANETARNGKHCETKESKLNWWERRRELDRSMGALVTKIEDRWLGGLKGLLIPDGEDEMAKEPLEKFRLALEALLIGASTNTRGKGKKIPSGSFKLGNDLCKALTRLTSRESDEVLEDAVYFLLDSYHLIGMPVEYDEIDVDRLVEGLKAALDTYHSSNSTSATISCSQTPHLILVLDKHAQLLPWESMPILRNIPTCRVPTLSFLRDRILITRLRNNGTSNPSSVETEKSDESSSTDQSYILDADKTYYILNPSGDLSRTQEEFAGWFETLREGRWEGVVGRRPAGWECERGLGDHELYIYFGHSGGEQYIRGHQIRRLKKCAVALLIGCSSGRLKPAGDLDPWGNSMNYMLAGCPALVANLWDVTDRDIDRFSRKLLSAWGIEGHTGRSLAEAVCNAREECTLRYLNGAAPVVYGIPVYIR
ncbi:uncharacterized protein VTP21DRAFT_6059 [Calcarisporiella thermophila]|uniref:uncharacterized protein n=1 Tax=Calcarisporiella thermophila TaxID=911321 RepID=UPI00374268D8